MPDDLEKYLDPAPRRRGYDEDAALDLIAHHESGGRNIKQQVVPEGGGFNPSVGRVTGPSTASGPWQITNTTWRKRAPREIVQQYPTAISAPVEVQRKVAAKMFRETGFQDWEPYNASLRKAIAKGEQPQPQKPSVDSYLDPIESYLEPPPVQQPRGLSARAAASAPVPRRQRLRGQVESAGLGAPPITRADIMRAEERPQASRGTYDNIDPRILKGEQPRDPMAYAKAQQLVGRTEPIREVGGIRSGATSMQARTPSLIERIGEAVDPYLRLDRPAGIKTDPLRGAASLGILDLRREITPEEKLIDPQAEAAAETAYQVGAAAPAVVPYIGAGKAISKIPALNAATREAHIARSALTFGGVELGRELARSAQTGEPLNPKEVAISTAIGASIGKIAGVDPSIKRTVVAFITPQVVVDVARGTDPQTATFNAITNLAFGLYSGTVPKELQSPQLKQALENRVRGEGREADTNYQNVARPTAATVVQEAPPPSRAVDPTLTQPSRAGGVGRRLPDNAGDIVSTVPPLQRGVINEPTQTPPPVEARVEGARAGTPQVPPSVSPVEGRRVSTSAAKPVIAKPAAVETPAPRHVDLQPRRVRGEGKGEFKKETAAQREERRQQVNPPQGEAAETAAVSESPPPVAGEGKAPQYPLAERSEWYTAKRFAESGGRMTTMTPDEFLARDNPLVITEDARSNIDALKRHIEKGERLDPAILLKDGTTDGRHRAIAAKEMGIKELPVLDLTSPSDSGKVPVSEGSYSRPQDRPTREVESRRPFSGTGKSSITSAPQPPEAAAKTPPESSVASPPTPTAVQPEVLKREVKAEIVPSEFINLRKLNISAEEKANLENTVRQVVSEGRVSKERVTFEDIKREAAEIDPELVRNLRPPKRGETLDPAVRFAARERLNTLNAESVRLQKELDAKRASAASDPKEIEQLESRLAQTETDAKGVLDVLIPTRSQDGKNLAYHRMIAQQSFDADYWLSRARRVAERSGEDVTGKKYQVKEKTIRDTLVAGRDAETRLAELEKQVSELRAKLEKADSGVVPEGKPTRAFRQKAESLQAKLDTAAEQARMRLKQRAESGGAQGGQAGASTIPLDIADYAIIGASKLARKGISTAVWTEEMIAEFGESIRPHIRSIYSQSYKVFQDESKALREAARVQTVTEGQPQRYTQAEIAKLVEQADAARKDVQKNRAQLARTFSNLEKTSVLETISALRKAGLLTGVKTHLRNVGSTAAYQVFDEVARVPAAITDLAVSAVSRRRSISGPNPVAVGRSSYQAATKGVKEAVQILKQGATQEDLAKLDIKREVNSGWRVIDAYTNGVFRLLGAQDKVFKTYAIKRSLEDQSRVIALNESRSGQLTRGEIARRTKELSESPTAEMAAQAITDAEVATFNNRGVISGAIQSGKSRLGQGGRFALDLLVPFVQTPSNVFTRLIEATPLGAAKAVGRGSLAAFNKNFTIEEQRAFSQTMGRSTTGTALIILGYVLASKGLATGTRDDEPAKAERDKAAGRSAMAIRVGDQWHQVGAFSPLANLVAIGATLYREEHQELKDESQRPLKIATIAGKTVLEQPMLKGVSSLTETLTQPGRSGPRLAGNIAGSFVPTLVSDVGAVTDNRRRDVKGIQDAVVNRIPLLRRTLPESVDVFGKPLEARRSAAVDPTLASGARDVTDPLLKELTRLDAGVPKSSRKPNESEADYRARIIAEGQAMEKAGRWLITVRNYSSMSDEEKRDAFKDAFEQAKRELKRGEKRAPRELRRRPFRIPRAQLFRS